MSGVVGLGYFYHFNSPSQRKNNSSKSMSPDCDYTAIDPNGN